MPPRLWSRPSTTRKLFLLLWRLLAALLGVSAEALRFVRVVFQSHASFPPENLFIRKQLMFYQERNRTATADGFREVRAAVLVTLFPWRSALVVVKPETPISWHRRAFQLFWRWRSRGGRPKLPKDLRLLIVEMVRENPIWGEARIAAQPALKLGIRVSPRTVRAYWPGELRPNRTRSHSWMVHNEVR